MFNYMMLYHIYLVLNFDGPVMYDPLLNPLCSNIKSATKTFSPAHQRYDNIDMLYH